MQLGKYGLLHDFNPRPPRGGRQEFSAFIVSSGSISIHALPAEGDSGRMVDLPPTWHFQSPPAPRRATQD